MNQTSKKSQLFFLALLPPPPLEAEITALKKEMGDRFQSHHALKSPPHITLFPPFKWPHADIERLNCCALFAQKQHPIPIKLSGFGAFPPRVIYVQPLKTPELLAVHRELQNFLHAELGLVDPMIKKRGFKPHMTIAHRDLTKANFQSAWEVFKGRSLRAEFLATHLTLLQHNGHCWTTQQAWLFCQSD